MSMNSWNLAELMNTDPKSLLELETLALAAMCNPDSSIRDRSKAALAKLYDGYRGVMKDKDQLFLLIEGSRSVERVYVCNIPRNYRGL